MPTAVFIPAFAVFVVIAIVLMMAMYLSVAHRLSVLETEVNHAQSRIAEAEDQVRRQAREARQARQADAEGR